jgi:acetolactate synthase-1/2/3 large subunit
MTARTGGEVLADQLVLNGVESIFAVAGESYLPLTDALYDRAERVQVISCRQEGGAAFMAEATGKLTGRPGVCLVTRGPGATNASIGVHTAFQDSTPMIMLVGQVARGDIGREAFQELDYPAVFGGLAKWVVQIDDAARIPEIMHRAFATAMSGRPGPVVVALPEDMLADVVDVADAAPAEAVMASPAMAEVDEVARLLDAAERPILIVGGSCWDADAVGALARFAARRRIPVATTFRRQDLLDNDAPEFAGALGTGLGASTAQTVRRADLVVAIGARLGEMSTGGYTLLGVPDPGVDLVHVHPDAGELNRVYTPRIAVHADPRRFVAELDARTTAPGAGWDAWCTEANAAYRTASTPVGDQLGLDLGAVVRHISDVAPRDTVITNGAGNYTAWMHRFHRFHEHPTQLGPTSGSMGYGLPAAIAAAVQRPDRLAIAFGGDGCILMNGQELATAVRYELPVIVIVVNNGHLGTIRLHQERRYPGRVINTGLTNPDFVAWGRAFGAHAERVEDAAEFPAAFARARAAGGPALIELVTDPEQSTPDQRLSDIRAAAEGSRT